MVENCCKPIKMSFQSASSPFRYPTVRSPMETQFSSQSLLRTDIASSLSPRTPSYPTMQDRVINTVIELSEMDRINNTANVYLDMVHEHILRYGDSDLVWKDVMNLPFPMQDLVMSKVIFTFAIRGEFLKILVPLAFYDRLGTEEAKRKKDKHIRQLLHLFKHMERSDFVTMIHDRFKGYDLL